MNMNMNMNMNMIVVINVAILVAAFLPIMCSSDLIEDTCRKTPDYQLCIVILRNDPNAKNVGIVGLTLIMLHSIKSKSEYSVKIIDDLLKTRPEMREPLTGCCANYGLVVKFFIPNAINAATKRDSKLGGQSMAGVKINADECDDGFSLTPPDLLVNLNKIVRDSAAVAASMFTMIKA